MTDIIERATYAIEWGNTDPLLPQLVAELKAARSQSVVVLSTQAELDELPIGSVVMTLWDSAQLHFVRQKYANGWYGFPSDQSLFPLGSGRQGETVALLWRGGDEARPGVVVDLTAEDLKQIVQILGTYSPYAATLLAAANAAEREAK